MDRLALFITVLGGASIAGALLIAAFSLGYHSVAAVVICGVVGLTTAYPTGRIVSRLIRRAEAGRDQRRDKTRRKKT